MKKQAIHSFALMGGCTLGGLCVGLAEGAYRGVPLLWSALLYGSLWALAGLGATCAQTLIRSRIPASLGFTLSVTLSSVVLGRFIIYRDVLAEAPGSGLQATTAAVAIALLVALVTAFISRRVLPSRGPWGGFLALGVLVIFGILTQLPSSEPDAPETADATAGVPGGVILVVVDTLRADALGAYGAQNPDGSSLTPAVDAFAKDAAVFSDMSAQASWTRPAMASIHTSLHASGHNTMSKVAVLPASLTTLAEALQQNGVQTGAVVTNYNLEPRFGFDQGFDHYTYLPPDRYLGAPPDANRLAAYSVYRLLREKLLPGQREARHFYQEGDRVNQAGLQLLGRLDPERPFFLWLHYMEPHDPYFAADGQSYARVSTPNPDPSLAGPMREAYHQDVRRFDSIFANLQRSLKAQGYEDVAILLTSDHGEEFAEHGGFYHGVTLYEEQLQLPLIIGGAGVNSGTREDLARQIDLAPTIAKLLGVAPSPRWEGRDLLGSAPAPAHTLAEEDHQGNRLTSIRQTTGERYKLIEANPENPRGLKPTELYSLTRDPGEATALTSPSADTLRVAQAELQQRSQETGAAPESAPLDEDAEAELRSLGYIQ